MAAAFTPTFGDGEAQYCREACKHTDCEWAREFVKEPCGICSKPMGEGVRYYRGEPGIRFEHAACVEAAVMAAS